jgi:hypothetical protein
MKEIEKNTKINKKETSRRAFMKKAVYSAPTVLVLGSLARPTKTKAAGFGPPPEGASFLDV